MLKIIFFIPLDNYIHGIMCGMEKIAINGHSFTGIGEGEFK